MIEKAILSKVFIYTRRFSPYVSSQYFTYGLASLNTGLFLGTRGVVTVFD